MAERTEAEVLGELEAKVHSGDLVGGADVFLTQANDLVEGFLTTGSFGIAEDPFGGADAFLLEDDQA